jgi:hypothetical protein
MAGKICCTSFGRGDEVAMFGGVVHGVMVETRIYFRAYVLWLMVYTRVLGGLDSSSWVVYGHGPSSQMCVGASRVYCIKGLTVRGYIC